MNIEKTMNDLRNIAAEVQELQRTAKEARKAALQPFLDELAKSGTVSIITVRGYTPGFNDGEPCEHSADFWVNVEQHWGDEVDETGDLNEIFEGLQDTYTWNSLNRTRTDLPEAIEANRKLCVEHGHVYDAPSKEIVDAIKAVLFDSIEEDYGTDYYVTFTLKDGKFVRDEGDYDCGY